MLDKKAKKIITSLSPPSTIHHPQSTISLLSLIEEVFGFYGLDCKITGEAKICADKEMILHIFDLLAKNIYDKSLQEDIECKAHIQKNKNAVTVLLQDSGSNIVNIESIFEPFFSTKEGGLGIGLYEAKKALKEIKADIKAYNS